MNVLLKFSTSTMWFEMLSSDNFKAGTSTFVSALNQQPCVVSDSDYS